MCVRYFLLQSELSLLFLCLCYKNLVSQSLAMRGKRRAAAVPDNQQTLVCLNTVKHSTLICTLSSSHISKMDKILSKEGRTPDIDPQTHIDKFRLKHKYNQPEFFTSS